MNLENSSYKKISVYCGSFALVVIALQLLRGYFLCEHQFIYSTDDTYTHGYCAQPGVLQCLEH